MDVREYMALMGVTFGGTIDQKLRASFEIFDRNGDGSLSKDEVRQMLTMVVRQVTRAQLKTKSQKVHSYSQPAILFAKAALTQDFFFFFLPFIGLWYHCH